MDLGSYFPVWKDLKPEERSALAQAAAERTVPRGTVIHNGDLDCLGLIIVLSGQLRAYILSDEGRELTIYRLAEGDICLFSAACMLHSVQFSVTVEAEKDARLGIIPSEVYKSIMARSAPLANYTNELMASRFSDVMWLIEQVLWKSMDTRLAAFLLEESALEGDDSLSITHERIANHLGTAREVVTRMLRYFQSEGMVKLSRGSVILTGRKALAALAGQ